MADLPDMGALGKELSERLTTLDDTKAAISGDRGACAGFETAATTNSAVTISGSSADSMLVTGAVAITLANGAAGTAFTKNVLVTNAGATITPGSGWKWAGGKVPEMKANSLLVAKWLGSLGVLSLIYTE